MDERILMRFLGLRVVTMASCLLVLLTGCATTQNSPRAEQVNSTTMSVAAVKPSDLQSIRTVAFKDAASGTNESADQPTVDIAKPIVLQANPDFADSIPGTLDLDTLLGMAFSSNPAVAQAEAAVAQASGVHCQVGLKPNPSIGYFGQEIGNDGAGGQHGLFASQTVVRGDKLKWNRCVTSHDVKRLKWEAETQRRRVETDVRVRFYRALAAQRKLKRAKEFRLNAERAVDVAKQRLEAEEGTRPDLLQSQLLVDQIDLSIRQSELEWRAAWAELAATLGQPSLQPREVQGDFVSVETADNESLYQEIVALSPQLSAAQARIDRARTNLQRQQNQVVPNLNVQLGVGFDDASDDTFANVQLGMPIPVHNRNQGNISAAQAEYAAASRNLRRLELLLRRDLAEVYRRYQSSAVAVEQYEQTMLPRAEESLALVEKARRAGEIDFLRVLTARQTLFEIQQKRIDARGELSQASAEIAGYLLTDALGTEVTFDGDDGLRGQAISGQ